MAAYDVASNICKALRRAPFELGEPERVHRVHIFHLANRDLALRARVLGHAAPDLRVRALEECRRCGDVSGFFLRPIQELL